jgi:outer membrane scaffolding protein for murein synthesis (MipA/OmpV family)
MDRPSPACLAGLALALILAATGAQAQTPTPTPTPNGRATERQPFLELGIAGGGAWRPDYPASDQSHFGAAAAPFLILRSELLRSDESGARLRPLRTGWGEFSLSAAGATPTRSADNTAREGMPDLGWMGEIGPSLRLFLWRDPAAARRLTLDLPVRAAFSADTSNWSVRYRGIVAAPELAFEQRDLFVARSRLRLSVGPIFGTGRLMDYYYEVQPQYARPGRPAFDAQGGYLGSRLQLSYRVPVTERLSVVVGGRADGYWGATNAGSPLFHSDTGFSVAAGLSWSFYRSERMVDSSVEPFD